MLHGLRDAPWPRPPRHLRRAGLAAALCLLSTTALAGIADTKHNLSGATEGSPMEVCVFCHTPSGDPGSAARPAWNLGQPLDDTTFTTFDDLGRFDPNRDTVVVGTVSVACLSCHDDTQALGVTMLDFDHPTAIPYRGAVLAGLDSTTLPRQNLDPEGYLAAVADPGAAPPEIAAAIGSPDFHKPSYDIIDDAPAWWLDTGGEGRQRTDLKLYARHFGDVTVPFVECASCHDPHTQTDTFLRIQNTGSRLCLSCHNL